MKIRRNGSSSAYVVWLLVHFLFVGNNNKSTVFAKQVSGDFRLSGATSHCVLTSFAVLPAGGGRVKLTLTSPDAYENERALQFRLYRDDRWRKFMRATTCREKSRHAQLTKNVAFQKVGGKWEAIVHVLLFDNNSNTNQQLNRNSTTDTTAEAAKDNSRPHYWYFVLDDCSLEEYFQDDKAPKIHYEIQVFNHLSSSGQDLSHLSADEHRLTELHVLTFLLSGGIAFLLTVIIILRVTGATTERNKSKNNNTSVHAALLWVTAIAALDAASSFCEIMHLQIYKANGVGSYFIDAVSAHLEAMCDALLVLLLLSIASGWTLPSDVITVNTSSSNNLLQRLFQDMSKPLGGVWRFNGAGALVLLVVALHVVLAQWGRTYNESFESYHDFEHLPGKLLMATRVLLGILFVAATLHTRLRCSRHQLKSFYAKLALLGFLWFQSLPVLTFWCNTVVPYYLRHPTVYVGSALLQSGSIVLFSWLVTSHSTVYHRFSHLSSPMEKSFTEQLANTSAGAGENDGARTWTMGKAKVRLD
jgi:hypothetical protein